MSSAAAPPCILVTGLPWSQVGQVAALLAAQHDAVFLPELNLCMAPTLGALQLLFQRSQDRLGDGLLRTVARWQFGTDTQASIVQAHDWLWRRSEWRSAELLAQIRTAYAPRPVIIADRYVGWRPDYLAAAQRMDVQILHVVRHPFWHGLELHAQLSQQAFVAPDFLDHAGNPAGVLDPQIAWYRFHSNVIKSAESRPASYQRLLLEDLQAQPQAVLNQLGMSLRLQTDTNTPPLSLNQTASPYLQRGPINAPMGLEADCMAQPRLQLALRKDAALSLHVPWRLDQRRLCEEVCTLARTVGYNAAQPMTSSD